MTQPNFVPLAAADRVRPSERLPVPQAWRPERPGDEAATGVKTATGFGVTGPDQGYALKLAGTFVDRLQLAPQEHADDAVAGCLGVALKRASLYGRAPVVYDLELAFTLFGFLTASPPAGLVEFRRALFDGASHHYAHQRAIADAVPEATLRFTPAQVAERLPEWRSLVLTGE